MQINRTTDYALRILHYLGRENRIVSSSEMANNMRISQRYLLGIAKRLKQFGYIKSGAGPDGGFSLAISLNDITLYEVISHMEGTIIISRCLLQEDHCDGTPCILHDAYTYLQCILETFLRSLTISVLIEYPIDEWQNIVMRGLYDMHCQYDRNNTKPILRPLSIPEVCVHGK